MQEAARPGTGYPEQIGIEHERCWRLLSADLYCNSLIRQNIPLRIGICGNG